MTLRIELKPSLYEQVINLLSQFKDIKIIKDEKKQLSKANELDRLYLDFLEAKSKGKTINSTADELIKRIENEL